MSTQQKETEKRPITQKEPLYKHSNMLIAWFFWKKHPHSKLWLNNFFLQLTILIVVSALFIFIYTYASSFNTIVISIFKLGSLIQICLIIIMVYTFYKLLKNIRYGIKGLANGFKLIAAVIFLLFCFEIFLQPGTLIEPLSRFDYSTFNPFEINLNSQNNGIISNNNENSDNNQGIVIPSINPKPVINIPELETQIHNLINIERQKNGVSTLQYDTKLSQIARAHSQDMANKNYFEHVNPQGDGPTERAIKAGYPVHKELGAGWYRDGIGENIYQNNLYDTVTYYNGVPVYDWNSQSEIASTTVNGWMNSPGHRQNILDSSYSNEGIGVSISSDDKVYITEDFW